MNQFIKNTLFNYDLRHTACREDALLLFQKQDAALSHGNVERDLGKDYDRVTIYRTLKTFVEKGLLHKVLDEDGLRYALCKDACAAHTHQHDHIHFKCLKCDKTVCLEKITIPPISLPDGYIGNEMNLLIQGVCNKCN